MVIFLVFRSDKIGPNQKSGDKMYTGEYDDLFVRYIYSSSKQKYVANLKNRTSKVTLLKIILFIVFVIKS